MLNEESQQQWGVTVRFFVHLLLYDGQEGVFMMTADRKPRQGSKDSREVDFRAPTKLLLLIAGGLLSGVLMGGLFRIAAGLEPVLRWILSGGVVFFAAGASFITTFSEDERKHELRLARYDAKQAFCCRLLDGLYSAMDDAECADSEIAEGIMDCLRANRLRYTGVASRYDDR